MFDTPLTGGLINSSWASVVLRALDYAETLLGGENEEIQQLITRLINGSWGDMSVPVGTILPFAGASLPTGFLPCNGMSLNNVDYPELYAIIGSAYGGDADTFMLPNLNGRTPIGAGTGDGITPRTIGQSVGGETSLIKIVNMPAHTHTIARRVTEGASGATLVGSAPRTATQDTQQTSSVGGNEPLNVMQPSLVVVYMIRVIP